jgi:kynureninase
MSSFDFQPGKDFAITIDARDPLKDYRQRFSFPKINNGDCVYLCGHSLGLQPKTVEAKAGCGGALSSKTSVDALSPPAH